MENDKPARTFRTEPVSLEQAIRHAEITVAVMGEYPPSDPALLDKAKVRLEDLRRIKEQDL